MPRPVAWEPRAPRPVDAGESQGGDELHVRGLELSRERILGVDVERVEVADLSISGCDLAGVLVRSYQLRRAVVRETRLREVTCPGGRLQDVVVEDVQTEQLSLRFSTLVSVRFARCSLVGADFYGVTFDHVEFDHCDLSGARFESAVVKALRTGDVDFSGVTGATALAGAEISLSDLASLAPSLARDVGLRFRAESWPDHDEGNVIRAG